MVLSEDQKTKLLDTLGTEVEQLPIIFSSDPSLEGIEVKAKDVIKIIRESETAGTSIYYRRVVEE